MGQTVILKIDRPRRELNASLHSAGHLIAAIVESWPLGLKAVRGHHFPGEACVEFTDASDPETIQSWLVSLPGQLASMIGQNGAVTSKIVSGEATAVKAHRVVAIDKFEPVGCGGTHVQCLGEIRSIDIRSTKVKSGRLKVAYSCGD